MQNISMVWQTFKDNVNIQMANLMPYSKENLKYQLDLFSTELLLLLLFFFYFWDYKNNLSLFPFLPQNSLIYTSLHSSKFMTSFSLISYICIYNIYVCVHVLTLYNIYTYIFLNVTFSICMMLLVCIF